MSLLVVGSVALDTIETPFGQVEDAVGGSAMYFSVSASHYAEVSLVAVIGEDFPQEAIDYLGERGVNLEGLHRAAGETFRWKGRYGYDLNDAETLDTQLNVFGDFHPRLPADYRECDYVFLANIDPDLQLEVLEQVQDPKFVACDTMNFWIEGKLDSLKKVLSHVDMMLLNETEARELAQEPNVVKAAQAIQAMGPKYVAIKRGEYGALLFGEGQVFFAPAYPLENVYDPTGAGDSFAGGLIGYLAQKDEVNIETLKHATVIGCAMASFDVEHFSYEGLRELDDELIRIRLEKFEELTRFKAVDILPSDEDLI